MFEPLPKGTLFPLTVSAWGSCRPMINRPRAKNNRDSLGSNKKVKHLNPHYQPYDSGMFFT